MLEVCVDSIESALLAVEGGASRLELCSALSEGGLTPSPGILKALKSKGNIQIPIYCMLRPRAGNEFVYSEMEIEAILYDMSLLQAIGCDGFVFGALTADGDIAVEQCKQILENAKNTPVTFHRAFDVTKAKEVHANCNLIANLGFSRILTSGFEQNALLGGQIIKSLIEQHTNITIMPGCGLTPANLKNLLTLTNCKEFHASCRTKKHTAVSQPHAVSMGKSNDSDLIYVTDVNLVKQMVNIYSNHK